jgi:hypothetical protein
MTIHVCRAAVILLWFIPLLGVMSPFTLVPDQGFRSEQCSHYAFLGRLPFRATFSSLIVAPTVAILLIYLKFHSLLWQRDLVVSHSISRQNIRYTDRGATIKERKLCSIIDGP